MLPEPNDFSTQRLRSLFQLSRERGYKSLLFGEETTETQPYILWRHDIDFDLPAAVRMAEVEAEEGIRATYFMMIRSWFYNLLSWEGIDALRRISDLGHGIGLHCDLNATRDAVLSSDEVEAAVANDFALLDACLPGIFRPVVSFHNPPASVVKRNFKGFYSAYAEKFFSEEIKYLSDSNRHWRQGSPEGWLDVDRTPRISLLLHPLIWAHGGSTMPEAVAGFLSERPNVGREKLRQDDVRV
jgi:hypothetical protein